MKLYTFDPAPNPRRLALFMQYKGIEIDTEQVDLMKGEQLTPEYRAINPECTVPALVLDDGTTLSAVIGICTYLEETHPEKPLLGTTALEKARVISWSHHLFVGLFQAIANILRNANENFAGRALPGPLELPQIPELAERGRQQVAHFLPMFDAHLSHNRFMAGDSISMADIDLLVALEFLGWVQESVPEDCKSLLEWRERATAELG
ncbi:MAG: glutathione S-transferase family protein [Halioglobus sp.]|nr:glutathione S-transferase family protein [Halioglobus sp.]